MEIIPALSEHLASAQWLLEAVVDGMSMDQLLKAPGGNAHSVGQDYLHTVISQDNLVHGLFGPGTPLHTTSWAGKTGVGTAIPMSAAQAMPEWHVFIENVKVDLPTFREYAKAVHASSLEWLGSLSPAELERPIDLSFAGMGSQSLNWCLFNMLIGHMANHTGEMSAIKGVQGLKGYPF